MIVINFLKNKEMENKTEKEDKRSSEIHMMMIKMNFKQMSFGKAQGNSDSEMSVVRRRARVMTSPMVDDATVVVRLEILLRTVLRRRINREVR